MMIFFGIIAVFAMLVSVVEPNKTNSDAAKWVFVTSTVALVALKVAEFIL